MDDTKGNIHCVEKEGRPNFKIWTRFFIIYGCEKIRVEKGRKRPELKRERRPS